MSGINIKTFLISKPFGGIDIKWFLIGQSINGGGGGGGLTDLTGTSWNVKSIITEENLTEKLIGGTVYGTNMMGREVSFPVGAISYSNNNLSFKDSMGSAIPPMMLSPESLSITGGDDVTDQTLITWLETYATRIS